MPGSVDETIRPSRSILSSYRAAVTHYRHPKSCQSLQRGIKIINLEFRDADNEAGGAGGAGAWPQRQQAHKASPGENIVLVKTNCILCRMLCHFIAISQSDITYKIVCYIALLCYITYDIACQEVVKTILYVQYCM